MTPALEIFLVFSATTLALWVFIVASLTWIPLFSGGLMTALDRMLWRLGPLGIKFIIALLLLISLGFVVVVLGVSFNE